MSLTDGAREPSAALLGAAGVDGLFERLLPVEDAPTWKPGRGSYPYAVEQCDVAPSEMMLVADHPWDVHGAHRAGLRTAWINRDHRPYPARFAPPEPELRAVPDLARQDWHR